MSALGQNRTLGGRLGRVRSTPQSGHCRTGLGMSALCQPLLFDHLVGERKQIIGDGNSKCLCSLKIDDQLKFSYLLDRQVLGLRPSENLRSIKPELTVCIGDAHAVAQHSASNSPIAKLVDSRQPLLRCETDNPIAPSVEVWVGRDQQGADSVAHQRYEGAFE